jgi:hypothetical protein
LPPDHPADYAPPSAVSNSKTFESLYHFNKTTKKTLIFFPEKPWTQIILNLQLHIIQLNMEKSQDPGTMSCSECTFVHPTNASVCLMCFAPNPVAVVRYGEMAVALAISLAAADLEKQKDKYREDEELANAIAAADLEEQKDKYREDEELVNAIAAADLEEQKDKYREDEELVNAIAELELMDLQEHKDNEEKNFVESMHLIFQINGDNPPRESHYVRCSACSCLNPQDRVQCIQCSTELDEDERKFAPGVVSRDQIALGSQEYDKGGKPDVGILEPLGFQGKVGNACMVNAIAYVTRNAGLSLEDLAILADRVTSDCKLHPGDPMWSDLMGLWFQELDFEINILYGPTEPEGKFQDWASLRKFNPKLRTFIIGNTGSHYAVYSPLRHP